MPKLHSRHVPHRGGGLRGRPSAMRLVVWTVIALFFFGLYWFARQQRSVGNGDALPYYAPVSTTGITVVHRYFALSYNEDQEVAEWVCYELERKRLRKKRVRRTDDYRPDPKVPTGSATPDDYRRSGWDRGHLVPAADMAFNRTAMSETFLMSNIAPQAHNFNGGIWRELEAQVRDWARRFRHLYIVTGPVTTLPPITRIGANEVAVPQAFYKVVLDLSEPELKAIAFVIPNEPSDQPLAQYAVTVDSVERLTGIDFFPELMEEALEDSLEAVIELEQWPFDDRRYRKRIEVWNRR